MFSVSIANLIGEEPLARASCAIMQMNNYKSEITKMEYLKITEDEFNEFDKHEFLTIQGFDKQGRRIVRVVGKFFPAHTYNKEKLLAYIHRKLAVCTKGFIVVYFQTYMGMFTLRYLMQNLPHYLKQNLQRIYFVHPGLHARLTLATIGRVFLSGSLYNKVEYVDRIEFLWENIHSEQLKVPKFVWEHDDILEYRPYMDYCFDSQDLRSFPIGPLHSVT